MTLEPVDSTIEEVFDVTFWPEEDMPAPRGGEVDLDEEADPEPIVGGQIDVGRVVFECLAAAVDPFPRRPDATLDRARLSQRRGRQQAGKPLCRPGEYQDKSLKALRELGVGGPRPARLAALLRIWLSRSRNRLWSFVFGGLRFRPGAANRADRVADR